jgi:hypothetical protein
MKFGAGFALIRLAVAHFELRFDAAAHGILRQDAIDPLRPRACEFNATAGDDERLEAVGSARGRAVRT